MGMFDKDKEIGASLTQMFSACQPFLLLNARVLPDPVPTEIGPARKTELRVARLSDGESAPFVVSTLASSIADKASESVPADFPAVVCWNTAHSKKWNTQATVLQWLRAATAEEAMNAGLDLNQTTMPTPTQPVGAATPDTDDVPF